jgi:predicted DNA-binding ribbon-helix-helix protein
VAFGTGGVTIVKSSIVKRFIVIAGRKTSVSLEDAFWVCVRGIAKERGRTVSDLVAGIDADRQRGGNRNLSSAIRLFVLDFYRGQPDPQSGTRVRFAA